MPDTRPPPALHARRPSAASPHPRAPTARKKETCVRSRLRSLHLSRKRRSAVFSTHCRMVYLLSLRRKESVLRGQPKNGGPARVERQLAMAQQITHIGSWGWNARTKAVEWSDELYRIYGLKPQSVDITFESFLERVHPADRQRVVGEVTAALERGGRFGYGERIVRPDGSIRHLQTVGEADRDEEGRVVGLIGACRDVTDELERDETTRLYADIVHYAQISLSVWEVGRPDDRSTVRLVAFNPAAERTALRPLLLPRTARSDGRRSRAHRARDPPRGDRDRAHAVRRAAACALGAGRVGSRRRAHGDRARDPRRAWSEPHRPEARSRVGRPAPVERIRRLARGPGAKATRHVGHDR